MQEPLINIEKLLGKEFDNAPRQLKATIQLILNALVQKQNGQNDCGQALNNLRQADQIVEENHLDVWKAELHAVWALYYHRGCPNFEDKTKTEERLMLQHIRRSQRLEPDNQTLNNVLTEIKQTKI